MAQRGVSKIDVLMMILKRLEEGSKVTTDSLAQELSVTERSIFRYLDTLQSAGYPIYFDRMQKTYRFVETFKLRPSGSFENITGVLDLKRKIFNSSSFGIATYKINGSCVWANSALAHLLNTTLKQVFSQNFASMRSWRRSGLYDLVTNAIQNNQECSRDIHLVATPQKSLWAHCIAFPFTNNNQHFVLVMAHDITARKQRELDLSRFVSSISKGPNLVMITDLNGTIEYVSDKITEITGYTRDEVVGKTPRIFQSGFTPLSMYENMWETITGGLEWTGELYNRRKSGSTYWEHISISPILDNDSTISHFVAIKEDVTRQKLLEEALYHHATSDVLTGLHSRRMMIELGNLEVCRAQRHATSVAILSVDIDYLKRINEEHGYVTGDAVLRSVSRALRQLFHPSVILGRCKGDEFVILLTGVDADGGEQAAETIIKTLGELPIDCPKGLIHCTASIGIARLIDHDVSFELLLDQAHQAAYKAKRNGGNQIVQHRDTGQPCPIPAQTKKLTQQDPPLCPGLA